MTTEKYKILIASFLAGKLTADRFQTQYFQLFKAETGEMSEHDFKQLDRLFADLDCFCADPELSDEGDIDEAQLRVYAQQTLKAL